MNGILFQELTFQQTLVKEWAYFPIDSFQNTRLYYKPKDEVGGFDFVVVDFSSCNADESSDHWFAPSLEVDACMFGIAYFDGLRHVYTNSKTSESNLDKLTPDGYNYYPSAQIMKKIYEKLIELEKTYCSSVDKVSLID